MYIKQKSKSGARQLRKNISGTNSVQLPNFSLGGSILSGAISGAAAGSAEPGWGTAIGAVVGGVSGLVSGLGEKNAASQEEQYAQADRVRQTRLGGMEASPNYLSVYGAYGAEVPQTTSNYNDQFGKDVAYYNWFTKNMRDDPKFNKLGINKLPSDYKQRDTKADSIATANPSAYYTMKQLSNNFGADTTAIKNVMAQEVKDFSSSTAGKNDPNSKLYGVRAVSANPSWVQSYNGKPNYSYTYDPTVGYSKKKYATGGEGDPSLENDYRKHKEGMVRNQINKYTAKYKGQFDNSTKLVSKDYSDRFPNLRKFNKNFSPAYYSVGDSAQFHPILDRMEKYVGANKLDSLQQRNVNTILNPIANPMVSALEDTKANTSATEVSPNMKDLQDLFSKASDKELNTVMSIDPTKWKDLNFLQKMGKLPWTMSMSKVKGAAGLGDYSEENLDSFSETNKYLPTLIKKEFIDRGIKKEDMNTEKYAGGGMIDPRQAMRPNAEAEGGETVQFNDGQSAEIEGNSHANGGVPLNLEPGDRIYSDRLKNPITGNTFADDHKKIIAAKDKEEKKLEEGTRFLTRISERTIKRNLGNYSKQEEKLFAIQQELNGEADRKRQQQMQQMQAQQGAPGQMMPPQGMGALNDPQMGAYGLEMPQYGGGHSEDGGDPPIIEFAQLPENIQNIVSQINGGTASGIRQSELEYLQNALASGTTDINELRSGMAQSAVPNNDMVSRAAAYKQDLAANPQNYENELTGTQPNGGAPQVGPPASALPDESALAMKELLNPTYSAIPQDNYSAGELVNPNYAIDNPVTGNDQIFDAGFDANVKEAANANVKAPSLGSKIGGYANAAATIAPMLYNIGEGLFGKKDKIRAGDYQNNVGMAAAARMRNMRYNIDPTLRSNRAAYQSGVRNLAARSRGEQLGNMSALSTGLANSNASAYATKENAQNQYRMAGDQALIGVGGQNAQTAFATKQYNDQVDNSAHNLIGAGLTGFSNLTQQRYRDKLMADSAGLAYNSMAGMYGDVAANAQGVWGQKNLMNPNDRFDPYKRKV